MKKILIIYTCAILLLCSGCEKYLDINKDPNNPENVQESLILAPTALAISQLQHGGKNGFVIQTYMQNTALVLDAPDTDTYRLANAELDGSWSDVYTSILNNLAILTKKAQANDKPNYVAISKILMAFTLASATDVWGDIPYSQAFKGVENLNPVYDKQEGIYKSVQALLDEAIIEINKNHLFVPGNDDYYYKGNMALWKKLAYTLKARYYMHLTKAPGYTAAAQADLAIAALQNGMKANTDDFKMVYAGAAGQESPWFLNFQPKYSLVLASTFVENLKSRNDPRLSAMAKPASSGLYRGRVIGSALESLDKYSSASNFYAGNNASNYLVSYSEALFLQAEALLIKSGFAVAQPVYLDAIKSHMQKLAISATDIATYQASRGLTAGNALQFIIEEKAVSNFLNQETFTDWRRTGFPALTIVQNATTTAVPRRLVYPQSEKINNPQPQQSATLIDRVWWDK